MTCARALLLSMSGLLLVAGLLSTIRPPVHGPVYSVAALSAHLEHDPLAWIGRVLLVRGILDGCPHVRCPGHEPYLPPRLLDPSPAATTDPLPVTLAETDSLLAILRGLPVLGRLVPAPQELHWEAVASYRIRVRATSDASCAAGMCYEAAVLDAGS